MEERENGMTTLWVSKETRERLYKKATGKETTDELINRLIDEWEKGKQLVSQLQGELRKRGARSEV